MRLMVSLVIGASVLLVWWMRKARERGADHGEVSQAWMRDNVYDKRGY
jgi:hypothetical protein